MANAALEWNRRSQLRRHPHRRLTGREQTPHQAAGDMPDVLDGPQPFAVLPSPPQQGLHPTWPGRGGRHVELTAVAVHRDNDQQVLVGVDTKNDHFC
ncbi:hypothetical protein [Micromonospora aurantiaca (nom. illeg.)]|uniref:hypothetical protein n=1 Tax=Micromonospora aurantiaca (nom. illeg.) TaxID=47850 RepID=UPI001CA44D08|nr:hypothetical protein [Micromonospora aurantiaca]